ncbi:MAG: hypothetical protein RLZZ623_1469 [Actinomycetota bacterium]
MAATPTTAASTATTEAATTSAPATTEAASTSLTAKEVLAAVSPSVVYLSTDFGSGTGLVLADGYVITNAHVVTPFGVVDVTPAGGEAELDVPVVGVDFSADLAVIGPISASLPAAPFATSVADVASGDAVYLVGYPSETETSPTPTIAQGIISRTREVQDFDQTYLQTDAAIAGGQSGGALVNDQGQVVGISGMSLDQAFALALAIDDVTSRIDGLMAGGDPWQQLVDGEATSGTTTLPGLLGTTSLELIASDTAETVTVGLAAPGDLAAEIGIEIYFDDGSSLFSRNTLARAAITSGTPLADLESQIPETVLLDMAADGTYTFEVPAGSRADVKLGRVDVDEPLDISFTSTRPFLQIEDTDDDATIATGDTVRGIIEPLEYQDFYAIELGAGEAVTITASSAVGDPAYIVLAAGEDLTADTFYIDDSNLGIGGLDASDTFTATAAGTYRIVVFDNAGASGYQLKVEAA